MSWAGTAKMTSRDTARAGGDRVVVFSVVRHQFARLGQYVFQVLMRLKMSYFTPVGVVGSITCTTICALCVRLLDDPEQISDQLWQKSKLVSSIATRTNRGFSESAALALDTSESPQVLFKLVEKAFRPRAETATAREFDRSRSLASLAVKEVQYNRVRRYRPIFHRREPDAVDHMVAVRFDNDLRSASRDLGQEPAKPRLGGRVQMSFHILHDEKPGFPHEQAGDDNRQGIGESESLNDHFIEAYKKANGIARQVESVLASAGCPSKARMADPPRLRRQHYRPAIGRSSGPPDNAQAHRRNDRPATGAGRGRREPEPRVGGPATRAARSADHLQVAGHLAMW